MFFNALYLVVEVVLGMALLPLYLLIFLLSCLVVGKDQTIWIWFGIRKRRHEKVR